MIVEYIGIVEIVKDEREKYEYIYDIFGCDDTNYSIFFIYYKYLFNVNPNYLEIRIISTLIGKMVNIEISYDK